MTLLDSLPHTCTVKRRTRTAGTLGGSKDSFTTSASGVSCWRQSAGDAEVTEYAKRGITVTDKVYFASDPGVDERDVLVIGSDTLEVKSRPSPDASVGLSVVWRVLAAVSTTGSTP